LEDITDAFRAIERTYIVVHSAVFEGIGHAVASQLYAKDVQSANRDYLIHHLERCLFEFNRVTSAPMYDPVGADWPPDLKTVDNCKAVWSLLFANIASRMSQLHQNIFQSQVRSKEVTRYSMTTDVLSPGNPFVKPLKSPPSATPRIKPRDDPAGDDPASDDPSGDDPSDDDPYDDESPGNKELKYLQSEIRRTQALLIQATHTPNLRDETKTTPSTRYCGAHILFLTRLGDPCTRGHKCRFTHPASIETTEIDKVVKTFESFWGTRVDPSILDKAYELIVAATVPASADRDDDDDDDEDEDEDDDSSSNADDA